MAATTVVGDHWSHTFNGATGLGPGDKTTAARERPTEAAGGGIEQGQNDASGRAAKMVMLSRRRAV